MLNDNNKIKTVLVTIVKKISEPFYGVMAYFAKTLLTIWNADTVKSLRKTYHNHPIRTGLLLAPIMLFTGFISIVAIMSLGLMTSLLSLPVPAIVGWMLSKLIVLSFLMLLAAFPSIPFMAVIGFIYNIVTAQWPHLGIQPLEKPNLKNHQDNNNNNNNKYMIEKEKFGGLFNNNNNNNNNDNRIELLDENEFENK